MSRPRSKISQEYARNRDRMGRAFPAAAEFLRRLEDDGNDGGLWLSTAQNAHLYRGRMFLAYIGLRNPEQQPPSLLLSPRFHLRVADDASDRSDLLFPELLAEIIDGFDGFTDGWAQRQTDGAVEVHPAAPAAFFDRLFEVLCSLGGDADTPDRGVASGTAREDSQAAAERPTEYVTLGLANFKGVRERVSVELRPLTLLFGPNSAGKSTLVQALLYLHEILEHNNVDASTTALGGDAVDLGGFARLVHGRDLTREIEIALNLGQRGFDIGYKGDLDECPDGVGVVLKVGWSRRLGRPIVRMFETEYSGERVATITCNEDGTRTEISLNPACRLYFRKLEDPWGAKTEEFDEWSQAFGEAVGSPIPAAVSVRSALLLDGHALAFDIYQKEKLDAAGYSGLERSVNEIVTAIASTVRNFLRELIYIGPLRELPPRNYEPPRMPDRGRWARGLAAWDLLHHRGAAELQTLGDVMSKRLHTGYHLEVEEGVDRTRVEAAIEGASDLDEAIAQTRALSGERRIRLCQDAEPRLRVSPSDVGVGISQLLPVAAAATLNLSPSRWNTQPLVVIEQPELHVHPAIQVELGDLFIRSSGATLPPAHDFTADADARRRAQRTFLLETHSEHLMLRLLRRIEETGRGKTLEDELALKPEHVAVYYVEQIDGCTVLRELRIDDDGEFLDPWPRGFFEERRKELF